MRIAVVGAGRIGEVHARNLMSQAACRSVVLYDLDRQRAAAAAEAVGAETEPDLDHALHQADGVVIASPTPTHATVMRHAFAKRIPVFCEKPVAATTAELIQLTEEAERHAVPVQVGFHYRFDPALRQLAEQCGSEPGPRHIRVHSTTEFAPSAEYLASAGGVIADKLIHELDLLRWLSGDEAVAVAALPATGTESEAMTAGLLVQLNGGSLASVWGGYRSVAGFDLAVEVETSTSVRTIGNRRPAVIGPALVPVSTVTDFRDRFADAYSQEIAAFLGLAAGNRATPCSLSEALRTQQLVETAQAALRNGQVVTHRASLVETPNHTSTRA